MIDRWREAFRLRDAAVSLLPGAVGLVGAVLAGRYPQEVPVWPLWSLSAAFLASWPALVIARYVALSKITGTTKSGVTVYAGGYPVPMRALETYIDQVIRGYNEAFEDEGISAWAESAVDGARLYFRSLPFVRNRRELAGYTDPWGKRIDVGWKLPIAESALGHELGHLILHYAMGDGDEGKLREFTARHGLPY